MASVAEASACVASIAIVDVMPSDKVRIISGIVVNDVLPPLTALSKMFVGVNLCSVKDMIGIGLSGDGETGGVGLREFTSSIVGPENINITSYVL